MANQEFKLKACPFCNGTAKLYKGTWFYVHCKKCGAESGIYLNEQSAAEAWNRRKDIMS